MGFRSFRIQPGGSISEAVVLKMAAVGCVIFGAFWLLVLSPLAWLFSAVFGALGGAVAAFALMRPSLNSADRVILRLTILAGSALLVVSVVAALR
ncbi:MAG: hypothetical protein ACM359_04500 [Bacillota bacterium]